MKFFISSLLVVSVLVMLISIVEGSCRGERRCIREFRERITVNGVVNVRDVPCDYLREYDLCIIPEMFSSYPPIERLGEPGDLLDEEFPGLTPEYGCAINILEMVDLSMNRQDPWTGVEEIASEGEAYNVPVYVERGDFERPHYKAMAANTARPLAAILNLMLIPLVTTVFHA